MSLHLRLSFIILLSLLAFQPVMGQFELVSVDAHPVTCYGDDDGKITIVVSGGVAPYEYLIFEGASWTVKESYEGSDLSYTFEGLDPITYRVIVEDSNGDFFMATPSVNQPDPVTTGISPDPADICPNTDRLLFGNPSGGNDDLPYVKHQWTGSGAGYLNDDEIEYPVFNSGDIGTYGLTYRVEDYKGCWAEESISIEVLEAISGDFLSEDATCFGVANGSVSLDWAMGGSGNYEYNVVGYGWKSEGDVFEGLSTGSYDVWVRDELYPDDCNVMIGTAVINEPAVLDADVGSANATCNGSADGTITISNPSGGYGTYEYSISGGISWEVSGSFGG
ncbi:MAG: SprB repeat-containing protein, partial [Bacteroidales bacterium]